MSSQSAEPAFDLLDIFRPSDPVPDRCYIARLGPSTKLSFEEPRLKRINFEAEILEPVGDPLPGSWQRAAYGHLYSCLQYTWLGVGRSQRWGPIAQASTLTGFLQDFDLYKRGMSTKRRVRVAKDFIESRPVVVVKTTWAAYSQKSGRTELRLMSRFPLRADGTHDPIICTEQGEQLRAVAHVDGCWSLKYALRWGILYGCSESQAQAAYQRFEKNLDSINKFMARIANAKEKGNA